MLSKDEFYIFGYAIQRNWGMSYVLKTCLIEVRVGCLRDFSCFVTLLIILLYQTKPKSLLDYFCFDDFYYYLSSSSSYNPRLLCFGFYPFCEEFSSCSDFYYFSYFSYFYESEPLSLYSDFCYCYFKTPFFQFFLSDFSAIALKTPDMTFPSLAIFYKYANHNY